MAYGPDREITNAASALGCAGLAAALIVLPPLILPAFILYRLASLTGVTTLDPAILIVLSVGSIWGMFKLGGMLIRSVSPRVAQGVIASYIGACYTFAVFQRELTTARADLDVIWLVFGFAIFAFIGWKIGGMLVMKAHADQSARAARRNAR